MFDFATVVSFLAISAVAPSARALPSLVNRHHHRDVPAQFQERGYKVDADLLEPYPKYSLRYRQFHCSDRHGTEFWDRCCHPLLKDEPLDALPDLCFEDVPCDSTTTSHAPEPTTTTTYNLVDTPHDTPGNVGAPPSTTPPPTTSTPHPSPSPTTTTPSGGGGGGGDGGNWHQGGKGTYYYQKGNAGACGEVHSDEDMIVALNVAYYGNTGAVSKFCGQKIELVNTNNGKSVTAIVKDVCPTCDGSESQDLSVGVIRALDPNYLNDGMIPIKWRINGL